MAQKIVLALQKASHDYYETGTASMTDDEYDALKEKLYSLDPKNAYFQEVGSFPSSDRVELPYFMPSLKKVKPASLDAVKLPGPFVVTEKLDGISALWTCGVHKTSGLYLRGNGHIGQDVSKCIKHIQGLVNTTNGCTVRGELIVPRSSGVARNWVNGVLHQITPNVEDCKKIHFVAYQVLEPANLTRSQQLTWLKNQGFETAQCWKVASLNIDELTKMFKETREKSLYECDGIVVGTDMKPLVCTEALPKDCFAYKVAVDDQRAETTVREIDWNVSRMGEWIPRIRFDPVKIGVANIEYCTGVHAQYIKDHMLGPGARIVVRRSGDVIPTLDKVLQAATKWQEPPEGRWKWDGIHAMDTTVDKTNETYALEMAHSLIALGIEGLSATSTKKIVDKGYKNLQQVWKASEFQLQDCIGKSSGKKLHSAINGLVASQQKWIYAYPSWPKGFGEKKIANALALEKDVSKWPRLTVSPDGQSMKTFSEVCKHVPAYLEWRACFPGAVDVFPAVPAAPVATKGYYVMTGFRDPELSAKLTQSGWIAQERINKDTNVLLVANSSTNVLLATDSNESTKTKAAREKGIRIVMRDKANLLF
jgi:NAD-dependent DNA ligase